MAGKKIRSRTSQTSISVSSLSNRPSLTNSVSTATNSNSSSHNSSNVSNNKPNEEMLLGMTKEQLRTECRKRGQKTTGNKAELLQRLGCKMANVNNAKRKDATVGATAGGAIPTTNGTAPAVRLLDENRGASGDPVERARREKLRAERKSLTLWRKPLTTIEYAFKETVAMLIEQVQKAYRNKWKVLLVLLLMAVTYISKDYPGPHQKHVQLLIEYIVWYSYWIFLGFLSSCGFGAGLHTFLLYLGPFIARVTLAAYECQSLDFPRPPYPADFICPEKRNELGISFFAILSKVRWESMMWGFGTALGELPPYFMAQSAHDTGYDDDDDLLEFEELQRRINSNDLTLVERVKIGMEKMVQKVGFWGIVLCASVPNPLYDLAGITCGACGIPFWTFFLGTVIGKALFKIHLQMAAVIIGLNDALIEMLFTYLAYVPWIGGLLIDQVRQFLENQKRQMHRDINHLEENGGTSLVSYLTTLFVGFIIACCVVTLMNRYAQNYFRRIHYNKKDKVAKD